MSIEGTERRRAPGPAVILAVLLAIAIVLRFWRLGHWGFEGDEIFTLRDSIDPRFRNPRPLLYLLNYYLVLPFRPLDEFGLRIIPALAGVLAIPVDIPGDSETRRDPSGSLRRVSVDREQRSRYQSQYARYWSLVFLRLGHLSVRHLCRNQGSQPARHRARDPDRRSWRCWRIPSLGSLSAGSSSGSSSPNIGREYAKRLWKHRTLRWGVLAFIVLAAMITIRYLPVLGEWIQEHDEGVTQDNLLHLPGRPGMKQIALLMSYVEGVTVPVVLAGVVGVVWLWQRRDRALARLLACLLVIPTGLLVLLSFRTPVSITYLLPTAPVFFIGAGVFLDRLADADWVAPALAAPSHGDDLHNRDRSSYPPVTVPRWSPPRLPCCGRLSVRATAPGDGIYSDQAAVLGHYLPGRFVGRLAADSEVLDRSLRELGKTGHGDALWVVVPAAAQGGLRTTAAVGMMSGWIYRNCQLRNTVGVARLDFRQNQLQVYRCPSAPASAAGSRSE